MIEFLYPTSLKNDVQWDIQMIDQWITSKKTYLSFAFKRFFPNTLPHNPFWLFLYYIKGTTTFPEFKGRLRYRFHVIDWAPQSFQNDATFCRPADETARVWFLIYQYQEVRSSTSRLLAYEDFRHPEGKNLGSCMRCSIAPAICQEEKTKVFHYP